LGQFSDLAIHNWVPDVNVTQVEALICPLASVTDRVRRKLDDYGRQVISVIAICRNGAHRGKTEAEVSDLAHHDFLGLALQRKGTEWAEVS
jgi:hypothetical protein